MERSGLHREITEHVIGAAYEVAGELGHGFLEAVYRRAVGVVLTERGHNVAQEVPLRVYFRGQPVGHYCADMVVDQLVIVEFKVAERVAPEHVAQLINYLKATHMDIGLIVNFGPTGVKAHRCWRPPGPDDPVTFRDPA